MKHVLIATAFLAFACGDDSSNTTPGDDANPGLVGTCEPVAGFGSYELIDAAFTSGAITLETSLAYKAFALFKDTRLPAECLGEDTELNESRALDDIYENWATLSPDTQSLLEPFLLPPAYVGSWANPDETSAAGATRARPLLGCTERPIHPSWSSVPMSSSGPIRVWYDTRVAGQLTLANTLLTAAETDILPKLVGTLGMRSPLSDINSGCNGGDGALDVYLSDMVSMGQSATAFGTNMAVDFAWKNNPTFVLIRRNLEEKPAKGTLAHEVMHASQWAYNVAGIGLGITYPWLKEATAQWAIDYVYPTGIENFEQKKAWAYIAEPFKSLDTVGGDNPDHMYGSYLFFLFLTKTQQPSLIKAIWDKTTMVQSELVSVDAVIPGGFEEQWPKFAKALWNRDPVETQSFETWDAMPYPVAKSKTSTQDLTMQSEEIKLAGNANGIALLDTTDLKHLSARYFKFTFPADVTTRSVAFSVPDPKISVQAFIQKTGSPFRVWEDWSGGGVVKHFCMDLTAERLTELVVVLSNDSATEDDPMFIDLQKPRMLLSSVGCWRYQGTTAVTINDTGFTETVSANVTLDVDPDPNWANDYFRHWKVLGGTASASSLATDNCTYTKTAGPGAMTTGNAGGFVDISFGYDFGPGSLSGRKVENANGDTTLTTTTTIECPLSPPNTTTAEYPWDWLVEPMQMVSVNADGTFHLDVTELYNTTSTRRIQWDFAPLRQP